MSRYEFTAKLRQGNKHESELDEIFTQISHYKIFPATPAEQERGIDRWFMAPGERFSVEYKTDEKAGRTGNAFIEIVSVDVRSVAGWAYTSEAEYLAYWNMLDELIYMIRFRDLRERLKYWRSAFPTRGVANKYGRLRWHTIGLLVPLAIMEATAEDTINL